MHIEYSKDFSKQLLKLSKKDRDRIQTATNLFLDNPFDIRLKNHPLKGKLK